jgi:hypothetical protein
VVEVLHCHKGFVHAQEDPSGMSRIGSLEVLVCTTCHNEPCIIRYLHKSSRV